MMERALGVEIEVMGGGAPLVLRDCVVRYELRAALSELFEVTLELRLRNPSLDVRAIVGHPTTLRFEDEPYWARLDGMTNRLRQLSSLPEGVSRYELTVVPRLWLTTRRRDHRIFQDKTVIEIAAEVLAGYGARIPPPLPRCGAHQPREYCVQYGESDFDFLSRVLADEGVSFYIDPHVRSGPNGDAAIESTLTFADDTTHGPLLATPVPYAPASDALIAARPHISSVLASAGLETSVATLRDYDFERPAYNFEARAEARSDLRENEAELESYTYEVGQFTAPEDPARAAQLLEESRSLRDVCLLEASFALPPGTRLIVAGHPADRVDGEHLVVATRSRVVMMDDGTPSATHGHETIPAKARYRPARRPKPRIYGTQTAFVVGKQLSADEIDVDSYGRVKVHFTWDRRETSFAGRPTRHIRVAQAWAGQGYGMVLLPRVGDELVISYIDGDPDEPIAVGRVHNAVYTSPLKLPDTDDTTVSIWKSRSSPAEPGSTEDRYNMVRMQDKSGDEMLELRAQRDFHQETLHDSREEVGGSQTVRVQGGQSTSAGSISMSAGSTFSASAGTDMTLTAGGTLREEGKTVLIRGTGVTSVHGGASLFLHGGSEVHISSNGVVTIKASTAVIDAGTVQIKGSAKIDAQGGIIDLNC